ncbi:Uncharacterised protein [Weissella viridescens]|uniref:DNA polymerase III PolC-type N-terminal domain-containing protein n=1 Tax=Weissella viridescens TaxID=1629 RepID=A0A380P798_WEIVI|nr:Uncharacterised protein [Weissella viridescens]
MALSAQEQFQTLLKQLDFETIPESFNGAALEKLVVHKSHVCGNLTLLLRLYHQ